MMKEPTKFQKSIVEQIEKIGDAITTIEQLCDDIEKLDPVLVSKIDDEWHYGQPILKFIINHRKYTVWYNEMRDFIFQELVNGAYISKNKY
nr:MAG: hypothetical protein [uncultured archaeon]